MGYNEQTVRSLATTAEVLVNGRGYRTKNIEKNGNCVDVIVTSPKSADRILIRIITDPYLASGRVGKQLVEEIEEQLKDERFERAILIAKSFTAGAKSDLKREGIEFIPKGGSPLNLIDPLKLYPRIQDLVNNLCKSRCGKIPKSEKECKGYNPEQRKCPTCEGTGTIKKNGRELVCPDCKGKAVEPTYTCNIRLTSDNADFHFERGWATLLQHDLNQLLEIQSTQKTGLKLSEKILEVEGQG